MPKLPPGLADVKQIATGTEYSVVVSRLDLGPCEDLQGKATFVGP